MTTDIIEQRDHVLGNPDTAIILLEYGDYECPYCGRAHKVLKRLLEQVGDQIRFSFRNFPLSEIHPHALSAALAAESAGLQGKFWEMHDLILENQRTGLAADRLVAFAQSLSLNMDQFKSDMDSPELFDRVHEDFMSGVRSGVNGTPTFFINGQRHDGPADLGSLRIALGWSMQ